MLILRTLHRFAGLLIVAAGLFAQGTGPAVVAERIGRIPADPISRIDAPVLGYFFDNERRVLQSMVGIPGSGFPGKVLATPEALTEIAIAPSQDYALAVLASSGRLVRIALDGRAPVLEIPAGIAGISRISISPSGTAALVYAAATGRAQILTKLTEEPAIGREYDWSGISGQVTAMAINDDGDFALVAYSAGGTALFGISANSGPAMLYRAQEISSLAFLRNSREALAAAPVENELIWIRNTSGVPNPVLLAGSNAGLQGVFSVMASEDGTHAFAIDKSGGISSLPLAGGPTVRVLCGCEPTQLQRMRGRDVFLLTSSLRSSVAVLDAGGESMEVVLMRPDAPGSRPEENK